MLTLNLAPEIETHLRTLAQKQGLEPTTYAERLIVSVLPDVSKKVINEGVGDDQSEDWREIAQKLQQSNRSAEKLSIEERLAAFNEWVTLPRREMPKLSDEALSRESIYGDRG